MRACTAALASEQLVDSVTIEGVTENLAAFAMEHPEVCRVWLFEMLRLSLHGTLRPEKYPELDAYLRRDSEADGRL